MTFVRHIVCVPRNIIMGTLAPLRRTMMLLLGPQINYMPDKSHVIVPINIVTELEMTLLVRVRHEA